MNEKDPMKLIKVKADIAQTIVDGYKKASEELATKSPAGLFMAARIIFATEKKVEQLQENYFRNPFKDPE